MFASIKRIISMNKRVGKPIEERDEDGLLTVNMTVRDDSNFISPFSYSDKPMLSAEAADFLDNAIRPRRYKEELHLIIHSNVIDDKEKQEFQDAIRNYYHHSYLSQQQKGKREMVLSFFLLLASLAFLALMVVLDRFAGYNIFIEIVDIIAWVFMWEAADIFFLQRHVSVWLQHKNIGYFNAKISFVNINKT